MMASQAELAVIAIQSWFQGAPVTNTNSAYARTYFDDSSCRFMAEHHGVDIWCAAHCSFRIGMKIGPADSHCLDLHLYFARARIVNQHRTNPKRTGRYEFCGSHL